MDLTILYKTIFLILTYLFGALPVGYIVHRIRKGDDIRDYGSGNVGGTNVARTVNFKAGLLTIILDVLKGLIPILILYFIYPQDILLLAITSVVVILGHDFPVYLGFKGGKGISTSFGVIIGVSCIPFIDNALWLRLIPVFAIFLTWLIVFLIFRIVSVASISAAVANGLSFYFARFPLEIVIASIIWSVLTIVAHRENIARLIRGEEKRIIRKGK